MPNEKKDDEVTGEKYYFHGSKNQGEVVDRVVLSGTSVNPERFLEVGGPSEVLTDEEVKELRAMGYDLRQLSEKQLEKEASSDTENVTSEQQQQQAQKSASSEKETDGKKGGK